MLTLDAFLSYYPPELVEFRDTTWLEVTGETLPDSFRIVVLRHAR